MSKRIKPLGDGKWCWTENCSEHSTFPALQPPDEKTCASLQKSAKELMSELPSRRELLSNPVPELMDKAREATINLEYAKLHLAITPKGRRLLEDKYRTAPEDQKATYAALINDSTALSNVYARNYQRFHYGSSYVTPNNEEVRAIPVSLDNIMSVNDWVSEATRKLDDWKPDQVTETNADGTTANSLDEEDPTATSKNKTKVFRKKNKLFYRNADGQDTEIKSASYLIREGKDNFTVVEANEFEKNYAPRADRTAPKLMLEKIERERFFPSTKLSTFIQMG